MRAAIYGKSQLFQYDAREIYTLEYSMPERASNGDMDNITKVNFHPCIKPIINPVRKLERYCRDEPNLSPIPSLTLDIPL